MPSKARDSEQKGEPMRHFQVALVTVSLLLGAAVPGLAAPPHVVWSEETENFATPRGLRFGAAAALESFVVEPLLQADDERFQDDCPCLLRRRAS